MFLKYSVLLIFFLSFNNVLSDEESAEKKMRGLAKELRCMVCQNQSLLESDSELAKDLKSLIKEKFSEGESSSDIKKFLVRRYGEFILFKPVLKLSNLILWLSPLLSILLVAIVAFRKTRISNRKK
tara:strand:- start:11 stop:388 length:378 start_codon:yes stop_codon:yes gene_type:complete